MADEVAGPGQETISDQLWDQIRPLLPAARRRYRKGRPRMSDRQAMAAVLYRLRTGCAWKALPRGLGAPSTVHDRFQEWRAARVFQRMLEAGLLRPEDLEGAL